VHEKTSLGELVILAVVTGREYQRSESRTPAHERHGKDLLEHVPSVDWAPYDEAKHLLKKKTV